MFTKDEIVAGLETTWASITELLSGLSDEEWAVQSLCPDWDVKGVLVHMGSIERILDGWIPQTAETPLPFDQIGAAMADLGAMSGPDALASINALMAKRLDQIKAMSDEQFNGPSMTPVGPKTYARFMAIRQFDFWVHEQDMRVPLGKPGDPGEAAARLALNEVVGSLGFIFGKKVGLGEDQRMAVHLTGQVEQDLFIDIVNGRASQVEELSGPATAELTVDMHTFMLLACGRIDPQTAIDAGTVSWSGDAALGEHAARNLRFTM